MMGNSGRGRTVMRSIVPAASAEAGVTRLFLIVSPSLFSWLIFDAELSEPGRALGRLGGIALLGFALTGWPAPATAAHAASAMRALLIYNLLATIYLAYLGLAGHLAGMSVAITLSPMF